MPPTSKHPRLFVLHPGSVWVFLALVLAWVLAWLCPEPGGERFRVAARLCGYLGALAMLVPYLHIARRWARHRHLGENRSWLAWHVAAAYAAFFFVLVHSRGRANGPLTLALLISLWVVMVSGAVGYYGQKLIYALLPKLVRHEYGLERIEHQRRRLLARARVLVAEQHVGSWTAFAEVFQKALKEWVPDEAYRERLNASLKLVKRGPAMFVDGKTGTDHLAVVAGGLLDVWDSERFQPGGAAEYGPDLHELLRRSDLSPDEVRARNRMLLEAHHPGVFARPKGVVRRWCAEALRDCFEPPLTFWRWLGGRRRQEALSKSFHDNAREFAESGKGDSLNQLWGLVQERRELDLEYRLHQLGRLWLLFHGPAAWALFALMIEHIVSSALYGGW
jgi:hypothetical protein